MTAFGARLRYGDPCPVCGGPVKAIVESRSEDGPRVYNSECSQYQDGGRARFIFHQEEAA